MIEAVLDNLRRFWMVHALLGLYTVLLAHHAWTGNRKTKGVSDYYVGGRAMSGVALGISFFATYSSTNSFVGFSGQAYTWGIPWLLFVPTAVFFCIVAWTVVAPRLREFTGAMGSLTIPDFIGFRFGSTPARVLAALIVMVASFLYMTAIFKGIGNLVEVFLEIPYKVAIGIVFVVVVAYTAIGGFISVVKTDVVQGVVMIFAAILLFGGTVSAAGGLDSIWAVRDQPGGEALFQWGGGVAVPVLLGVMFAGLVKFVVDPRQLSRFYALEDRHAARTGLWVSTLTFGGVYALLIPVGIYARRIFPTGIEDTDLVVPGLLTQAHVFNQGAAAFLLVAMVAAAMSSLDSVLLVMASTVERDIVSILRPGRSERQAIRWTRGWVFLFAGITALIALNPPGGIVSMTAFSGSLYGACFFPAIVLGLYWRRGSGAAVITSFAAGVGTLLLWDLIPGHEVLHKVFPALILATAAYVGTAILTEEVLDERIGHLFAPATEVEPV
ncbi:MAG: sodium:solute symporter [Gemmatimonadota bacterium]